MAYELYSYVPSFISMHVGMCVCVACIHVCLCVCVFVFLSVNFEYKNSCRLLCLLVVWLAGRLVGSMFAWFVNSSLPWAPFYLGSIVGVCSCVYIHIFLP